ncbi:MAG: glycoside hydrolase family 88 protein [Lachnospiraceae bacterium]|nr:glycoside hydrolase family 88 protein [Lachnospiraceae bacterium]
MAEKIYREMTETACKDLLVYPKRNLEWKLKNRIKKSLGMEYETRDPVNWPCGLMAAGLSDMAERLSAEEKDGVVKALSAFYDRWIEEDHPLQSLEDTLSGTALLWLYGESGETRYRRGAHRMVKYLLDHERDEEGSLPYRPKQKNGYVLSDMLGMVCPFLTRYAKMAKEDPAGAEWDPHTMKSARELACTQIDNFFRYGIDEESGLPFHGYVTSSGKKLGITGWGRAVGWVLSGLSSVLENSGKNSPEYERFRKYYEELTGRIWEYQYEDGLFGWQLTKYENEKEKPHADTSATAMILNAVCIAERALERRDPAVEERIGRGIDGLKKQIRGGRVMNASAECLDIGVHPQIYGAYPWSLGPSLSLFANAERNEK